MAQLKVIIGFFTLLGATFWASTPCFAESEYIASYGKAEAEYSSWLAGAVRDGKKPSPEDRRTMHSQLFADAQRAYVKEVHALQAQVIQVGKQMMRDLKNYNPPAPAATASAAPVAQGGTPAAPATPGTPAAAPGVNAGVAEMVSFKGGGTVTDKGKINFSGPATPLAPVGVGAAAPALAVNPAATLAPAASANREPAAVPKSSALGALLAPLAPGAAPASAPPTVQAGAGGSDAVNFNQAPSAGTGGLAPATAPATK